MSYLNFYKNLKVSYLKLIGQIFVPLLLLFAPVPLLLLSGQASANNGPEIAPGVYACDGAAQAGPCNGNYDDGLSEGGPSGYWGAVVTDAKQQVWSSAWRRTSATAQGAAMKACENGGNGGCESFGAFRAPKVMALAIDVNRNLFYDVTDSAGKSQKKVMERCHSEGDGQCKFIGVYKAHTFLGLLEK